MAFFPLFLHTNVPSITLTAMVAHVTIISFLYQASLVFVGNAVARKPSLLPSASQAVRRLE